MALDKLIDELGYRQSPFYREGTEEADLPVAHLLRDAQRAHVRGTYFIRTRPDETGGSHERPAVHAAEAKTPDEARRIHKQLWNQGTTPFLLVSMPGQVRVYTNFAYDNIDEQVGQVERPIDTAGLSLREVAKQIQFLQADSIDSGNIWRTKGARLTKDKRVDQSLLRTLRSLSTHLVEQYHLDRDVAHSLIGRFVYLHYLREREILSDEWLARANVDPNAVFSAKAKLNVFRRLADKVDERFNGRIFPIDWSASSAPCADAVKAVARRFAGEDPASGQMALFSPFDFSFIPIELLSGIYEQFLHDEGRGAKEGAYYTPEPVASYLLAEVERVKPLKQGMKVLDPCCGSGMFLVLAYRRLVEQELHRRRCEKLPPENLRDILTNSIFGVERNPEACLVTEFSLILTLLSYIDPPELHHHAKFRFPVLHNDRISESDFFDDRSRFWKSNQHFDWIVGNPPWVELDPDDKAEHFTVDWIQRARQAGMMPVARYRSSEAFTWRVRDRLGDDGVVGMITSATSLTNDQSAYYRKAFFLQNTVHRITNFSNLAYVLFESAEEPAATLVYSIPQAGMSLSDIVHFGPLVADQPAIAPGHNRRRPTPWVLTISESEIKTVPANEAMQGEGTTWKSALWGNPRDRHALERLKHVMPTTIGDLADKRRWHLSLGLQLRRGRTSKSETNQSIAEIKRNQGMTEIEAREYAEWFGGLKVVEPGRPGEVTTRLTVGDEWLVPNRWGTFIREGRHAGLGIVHAPHLFLWNDFAAFSSHDFIFRHPKLGLSAPKADAGWLRAVSMIWASSITPYRFFLELSAGWGISRSTIDLGDVRRMPIPDLTDQQVGALARLHRSFSLEEMHLHDRADWQRRLDDEVATILRIPSQIMLLAREFGEFRLPLVKGKAPLRITRTLNERDRDQLEKYARRLTAELDGFMERKSRGHRVTMLVAPDGVVATVELVNRGQPVKPAVKFAGQYEEKDVRDILYAAEQKYAQWVYVRRSVRVLAGSRIHLCKPARRLEWTETQALLDAADIIAEVAENRGRKA